MTWASGTPEAWSSRCSSATLATVAASAAVCLVKSLLSSLATCKPSGTATMPSRTTTRAITVSVILRAISNCRSGAAEPESAPIGCLDQARDSELAAQRGDVHVEDLRRAVPVSVPGGLEHFLAAHQPARIDREHFENVEFLGCQRDLLAVDGHLPGAQVDRERPVFDQLPAWPDPPEHGADSGLQLSQPERLDQVVVGACVQRGHPVRFFPVRGDHDDRDVVALAQLPAHGDAVAVRQLKIEQHYVGHGAG